MVIAHLGLCDALRSNRGDNWWFLVQTFRRIVAIVASAGRCPYGSARMKRRSPIVLALAVALAVAASGGAHHARAAQNHDYAAPVHGQTHDASDRGHSDSHAAAASAEDGATDRAGSGAAQPDQPCCYTWCHSVAAVYCAAGLLVPASDGGLFATAPLLRMAVWSGGIDPPPR